MTGPDKIAHRDSGYYNQDSHKKCGHSGILKILVYIGAQGHDKPIRKYPGLPKEIPPDLYSREISIDFPRRLSMGNIN